MTAALYHLCSNGCLRHLNQRAKGNLLSKGALQPCCYCQVNLLHSFATSSSVSKEQCLRQTREEEEKEQCSPKMTLRKPGHNLSKEDSATVSSHEAIPTVKDGPEGYSEDGPIVETEDDRVEASYANSTAAQSEGKAKNDRKYEDGTGSPEVDSRTIVDSPTMRARCVTLRPSRFGTPFAYESYQPKHDFFKGLLPDSTRLLFDQVVAEASTLKELLLTNLAPTNNRRKGLFCALNERDLLNVDFDSSERSDRGESKLQLHVLEPTREKLRLHLFVNPAIAPTCRTDVVQGQPH